MCIRDRGTIYGIWRQNRSVCCELKFVCLSFIHLSCILFALQLVISSYVLWPVWNCSNLDLTGDVVFIFLVRKSVFVLLTISFVLSLYLRIGLPLSQMRLCRTFGLFLTIHMQLPCAGFCSCWLIIAVLLFYGLYICLSLDFDFKWHNVCSSKVAADASWLK